MAKIPTYEIVFDPNIENVYGISPVYSPANEVMFVALSKTQQVELSFNEEKREVTGIVLIPDQIIPRRDCNLVFRENNIRLLAQSFLKDGHQNTAFYNHEKDKPLEGWDYIESWIIEDPERDKSAVLGLTGRKKGAWAVTAKVTNDELWADVKAGKLNGFSIDSLLKMKEIQMAKSDDKDKVLEMGIFSKKKDKKETELTAELVPIEVDGLGTLYSVDWAVGSTVFKDAEGKEPLYSTDSIVWEDKEFSTDADGKIIDSASEPEVDDESQAELEVESDDETIEQPDDDEPKTLEEALALIAKLKGEIEEKVQLSSTLNEVDELKAKIAELETELSTKENEVVELKKQPAAAPLRARITDVELKNMTPYERFRYQKTLYND